MILLIRYGEIFLKGLNRPYFERLQAQAIRHAIRGFPNTKVSRGQGRFYVTDIKEQEMPQVIDAVTKVFGLHSVSPAIEIKKDMDSINSALAKLTQDYMEKNALKKATFKVEAKRADKSFPVGSMDIAAQAGAYILNHVPGLTVDVHTPDIRVHIEVREQCYGYVDIIPAVGGMPQRSNGRAMLLLSGGIDSPVAGYMIAKRGVEINAVHYHSFPYTSEASKQKVIELAKRLSQYTGRVFLHVVGFTEIQQQIHEKCPPEMMVLIMRRFMMRIAEKLGEQYDCKGIITGESIGQVASQTLDSLVVTDRVVDMPVFRPLVGMDKIEIMDLAREIGTYETSILPHEDCCTVFVPKHPLTHPRLDAIEQAEQVLDVDLLVEEALEEVERIVL